MPTITGRGQRAVKLLHGIARVEELLLHDFARVGMKDGDLLLPRVQITSHDGHEGGLLAESVGNGPAA